MPKINSVAAMRRSVNTCNFQSNRKTAVTLLICIYCCRRRRRRRQRCQRRRLFFGSRL